MPQASQLLSDFVGNHFSVLMTGAVANGTADDTAAIQSAINAVAATTTRGEVRVPVGTYLIGQINMAAGIKLRCESGVIFLANAANVTMFSLGDKVSYSGIIGGGCSIRGNGHSGVTGISVAPATEPNASQYNTFNDIVIGQDGNGAQAVANGVFVQWSFFNTFTNVNVPLPRVSAFVFSVAANSCVLINCSSISVLGGAIAAQTNAAAAVFTASGDVATGRVTISGYTGAWAAANGVWTVTLLGGLLFSIPLNSTGFAAATGTPIYLFASIPVGIQSNNNGPFTAVGCTIQGTMLSVVYQADCVTFLNCYFEDSGAAVQGPWVQVGSPTGTQTSCVSFIGCIFNEGTTYALDVYQVYGLVIRGCSFRPSLAGIRVWNSAANSDKRGWDIGANDFTGVTPFYVVNATTQDVSSNISQDVVAPLKFTGAYAFGSPAVPPDASMAGGEGTIYMNPQTGILQYKYQKVELDDVTSAGAFTGTGSHAYTVQVTAAGTPDTVQWQEDGGAWTTGVALTGAAQTMSHGVQFKAAATTGHAVGAAWTITVQGGISVLSSQSTNPATLQYGSGAGLPNNYPTAYTFGTVISGYTGSWAGANGTFTATVLTDLYYTIPVNATGFGTATGSPVSTIIGPAIKSGTLGVSVGADRYYYNPAVGYVGDPFHSIGYLAECDGAMIKGYGGNRISQGFGGTTEDTQSLAQFGSFDGTNYHTNIMLGKGFVAPLTGATVQIGDDVNNFALLDVIAGSAQGTTPLLRLMSAALASLAQINHDGSAQFAALTLTAALATAQGGTGGAYASQALLLTALLAALSNVAIPGNFGCNGAAAQTAAASGGAVATTGATQTTPYGFTTAAQANGIVTLLNSIRAALVANGIMS